MNTAIWIFLSDILLVTTIWAFILEFNKDFNREEDFEKIAHQIFLNKAAIKSP